MHVHKISTETRKSFYNCVYNTGQLLFFIVLFFFYFDNCSAGARIDYMKGLTEVFQNVLFLETKRCRCIRNTLVLLRV